MFLDFLDQKTGGRGASRAGAVEGDRDGGGLHFGSSIRLDQAGA